MNSIEIIDPDFLLQQCLEDLHLESIQWMSEIEFWETELNFFHKLLMNSTRMGSDEYDDLIIEGLIEKYSRFQKRSITGLNEDILEHEQYLLKLKNNNSGYEDDEYRERHSMIETQINNSGKMFKSLKKELLNFVEELL